MRVLQRRKVVGSSGHVIKEMTLNMEIRKTLG